MAKTWKMVEEYFETKGDACSECPHCNHMSQSHPYGSTTATETWMECELLASSDPAAMPADCPGIEGWDEEEEVEEVAAPWPFPKS